MNYEKAYKEALEVARKINNGDGVAAPADWTVCETIFPVLREDYDDLIRGAIIDHLKDNNLTEWADWLEKQGEQKSDKQPYSYELEEEIEEWLGCEAFPEGTNITPLPKAMEIVRETANHFYDFGRKQQAIRNIQCTNSQVITPESYINEGQKKGIQTVLDNPQEYGLQKFADKVEPKFYFKVGQWIVSNHEKTTFLIESKSFGYFTFKDIVGNIYTKCLPPTEDDYHLWTIQDAKDGDILITKKGRPFIFRGLTDEDNPDSPVAYCGIDSLNSFYDSSMYNNSVWTHEKVFPATIEQRDLLFQKMKDAGYEWDAEKKELRKINSYCEKHCKGYQETGKCFADSDCKTKRESEQTCLEL